MGDDEIQEEDASSIIAAELEAGLLASIRSIITYNNNNIQGYFNDASAAVQSIIDFVSTVTTKDPTNIHLTIYNRAKEIAASIPNKIQEYTIPLNDNIPVTHADVAAAEAAAINANNTCLTVIAIKNTLTAHTDISIAAIEARNSSNNTMTIANTIDQNKNTTEYNKGLQAATAAATAATVIEGIITSNIVNINNAVSAGEAALNATNSTDISTASQTAAATAAAAAVAAAKCLMITRIHVNATTNKYLEVRMIKYALERATTSTTSTTGTTDTTDTTDSTDSTGLNSVPPKSKVELANDVVLAKQAAVAAAAQNVSVKREIADQAKLIMDMTIEQVNKCKTVTDILLKEYNDRRSGLST